MYENVSGSVGDVGVCAGAAEGVGMLRCMTYSEELVHKGHEV